jgi:hypothetical protein
MLMQKASQDMLRTWKETFDTYRTRLKPNNKPVLKVIGYLKEKYPVTELTDPLIKQVVIDNITLNECHAKKLPVGKKPVPKVFEIQDTESGKYLYEKQDDLFKGTKIIAGFDLESGYFIVEGSSLLWDELFVFRGLDEEDLTNFFLVAEYVECLKKSRDPDTVLDC